MSRVARRQTLRRVASAQIPPPWGVFQTIGFEHETSDGGGRVETALAVILRDLGIFPVCARLPTTKPSHVELGAAPHIQAELVA